MEDIIPSYILYIFWWSYIEASSFCRDVWPQTNSNEMDNVNTPTLSTQRKFMHQIQVLPTLNILFLFKYEWSVKSKQLYGIYF